MGKKLKWTEIGWFKKTKRPDMLKGKIKISELNLELEVVGFIKTKEQKRFSDDPDFTILYMNKKGDIPENLFE